MTGRGGLVGALTRHRRLIAVAGGLWLALVIGGGIFTSTLDARVGLHVFGPPGWYAGQAAVVRVGLHDLAFTRFAPLGAVRARFEPGHDDGPALAGEPTDEVLITGHAGTFVQGTLTPPAPGPWTLQMVAQTPGAGETTVRVPLTVHAADAPIAPLPKAKPRTPPRPDVGPLSLDIAPLDHVFPGNLPTALVVLAHAADGSPLQGPVQITVTEGKSAVALPPTVATDRHGLARIALKAMEPRFWFDLSAGEGPTATTAARRLRPTPTQFVLDVPSPRVSPGAEVPFAVTSLHREGPVFVDVWHGARWLAATSVTLEDRRAEGTLTLPALPDPAVIWVQAYRTAYLPQKARGGRHLLVSARPAAEANRWLAAQLAAQGIDPAWTSRMAQQADGDPLLTRALLGRLDRPERDPPIIADSSDSARQTVATLKRLWQQRFVWALIVSGLVMFIILGLVIRQNTREVQAAWTEAGGGEEALQGTRKGALVDAAYVFAVLGLFLLGLLQLLLRIHW